MSTPESLLNAMIRRQQDGAINAVLHAGGMAIPLFDSRISRIRTPVNRPTSRGGAYFSGTHLYRIVGSSRDQRILPLLSGMMLGPNAEFARLKISTDFPPDSQRKAVLYGHLTNSMQSQSRIELHIVIDEAA